VGRSAAPNPSRPRGTPTLSAFVDTNVLIRPLTGDPPDMAARATAALGAADELLLADLMRAAIALPSVKTIDSATLRRALKVYEVERVDFTEA
jgi:predicted nucleic acid-binding protein